MMCSGYRHSHDVSRVESKEGSFAKDPKSNKTKIKPAGDDVPVRIITVRLR